MRLDVFETTTDKNKPEKVGKEPFNFSHAMHGIPKKCAHSIPVKGLKACF